MTTGSASGKDWIDLRKGFLVESTYAVDEVVTVDQSEIYEKMGFEKFYQKRSMDIQIISELVEYT
ncbi:MAG: hypothetical protein K8R25_00735 [Methanosarcinales archaeon]|nr:hypothetical protein [Methanosarcinales archaeon]